MVNGDTAEFVVKTPWTPPWIVSGCFGPLIQNGARLVELDESEAIEFHSMLEEAEAESAAEAAGAEWAPIIVPIALRIAASGGARSAAGYIGKSVVAGGAAQAGANAWNWIQNKF